MGSQPANCSNSRIMRRCLRAESHSASQATLPIGSLELLHWLPQSGLRQPLKPSESDFGTQQNALQEFETASLVLDQ